MAKAQGPVQNLGPTGERVAENVRKLRGPMTYKELSDRLDKLGRPIPVLGLSRIEARARRVDADDLVALAMALEVTPNALLMPGTDERYDEVALTPEVTDGWEHTWQWAAGEEPSVRWSDNQMTGVGFFQNTATPRMSWVHRFFQLTRPYESAEERGERLKAQSPLSSKGRRANDGLPATAEQS